jgi:hypothetical protein
MNKSEKTGNPLLVNRLERQQDLSEEEVRHRLASYEDEETTNELYAFGLMLTNEAVQWLGALDSKAAWLSAYCGAIVSLMVSTIGVWQNALSGWPRYLPVAGATLAVVAAFLGLVALALRNVEWYSQDDWMNADCLSDHRRLKGFRVLTMWGILASHRKIGREKAQWLKRAQWIAALAIFLLYLSLLEIAWGFHAFQGLGIP